jgi:hypothetical protein
VAFCKIINDDVMRQMRSTDPNDRAKFHVDMGGGRYREIFPYKWSDHVDCSKGAIAVSLGQKVVLSFNGYWGKRSE